MSRPLVSVPGPQSQGILPFMLRRISSFLFLVCLSVCSAWAAAPGTMTLRIAVDQFGYPPNQPKVAVISDPQVGYNAAEAYTPGPTLQLRTWGSNTVVFTAAPVAWSN